MAHRTDRKAARFASIALALVAAYNAGEAHAQHAPPRTPTRYTLDNGLEVVLEERHDTPRVAVEVDYRVGHRDQPEGYSGIAHLTEHMMFTWARPGIDGMQFLSNVGTEHIVGETSGDVTRYAEVVSSSMLDRVLAFESDRMGFLLDHLTQQQLEAQRIIVFREREERALYFGSRELFSQLYHALFGATHPYRLVPEDNVESQLLTLDHVRWFHQRWYTPSNAVLVVVGDFDADRTRGTIARYFGGLARVPRPARAQATRPELRAEQRIEARTGLRQDRLRIAWVTPALYEQDDAEMDLIADIITARLSRRMEHDAPLALAVGAEQRSDELCSMFFISASAHEDTSAEELLANIDAELDRIRTQEVPAELLQSARARRLLSMREFDGSLDGRAFRLGLHARSGGALDMREREEVDRYVRATPASLRRAARRWLGTSQRVALIQRAQSSRSYRLHHAQPASGDAR